MKSCRTCGAPKPLDQFFRDGPTRHKPDCKACYRVRRKEWKMFGGTRDRQGVGEQARQHFAENPGRNRKENVRLKTKNPDKRRARLVIAMRIYRGTLIRPANCERCGVECKTEAHHHDYSKPLDVEWLCNPCHDVADAEINSNPHVRRLNADQVREIRQLAAAGVGRVEIARRLGVGYTTVRRILIGQTGKSVA